MRLVRMVDMDLNETLPVKINKNDLQIVKLGFKHCPGCEAPIEKVHCSLTLIVILILQTNYMNR